MDFAATQRDVLMARLRAGDADALGEVYTTHAAPLRAFANRTLRSPDLAVDVVQDVFVSVWERRTMLEIRTSLVAYLYAAVHRRCAEMLRHRTVELRTEFERALDVHPLGMGMHESTPLDHVERAEVGAAIREAIATLPTRAREIAILRWYDRLSRSEIAEALGIAVPTVNNQLTIAARVVRTRLERFR